MVATVSKPGADVKVRARVLRAFMYEGKPVAIGAELDLQVLFANEMSAANKVEILPPAAAPAKIEEPDKPKDARADRPRVERN